MGVTVCEIEELDHVLSVLRSQDVGVGCPASYQHCDVLAAASNRIEMRAGGPPTIQDIGSK